MRRLLVILILAAPLASAAGDDPFDPLAAEGGMTTWSPLADLLLRADRVSGLPGGREDLERLRARLRFGVSRRFEAGGQFGLVLRAALGSDSNRDNRRNLDNQRSNGLWLDQLWWRQRFAGGGEVTLGKAALPLRHSPLWWDEDLRPAGASVVVRRSVRDFDEAWLVLGAWRTQHLYGDRSSLVSVEGGWRGFQAAPLALELVAGWNRFSSIDRLAAQGLARGNRVAQGRYLSDFRLLHLQAALGWRTGALPSELRVEWLRNLGAFDSGEDRAARASLVVGDRRQPRQWEAGFAWQRFQRDAVLAAFSDDDWWFHTAARGGMPWVGYGIDQRWSLRLAAFLERRDDLAIRNRRWLLDLTAEW